MSYDPKGFDTPYSAPQAAPTGYGPPPSGANNSLAIAAMVVGILGLGSSVLAMCCCAPLGIPLPLIGLGLGIAALRDPRIDSSGRGMAYAGIACGAVGLIIALVMLLISFMFMGAAALDATKMQPPQFK